MKRLLVLHALMPGFRQTTIDHVLCYQRYLRGVEIVYHHLRQPFSRLERLAPFDGIVLNYCFLSHRTASDFETTRARYAGLGHLGPIVAVPQDDYTRHRILDDWLDDLGAEHIFSPVSEHREMLYSRCARRACFHESLTGYVEETRLEKLSRSCRELEDRPIDIGTRVSFPAPHFGRFAQRKGRLARELAIRLQGRGLRIDISTDPRQALPGEAWFEFLASCRFTLGQYGGASLADPDGSLCARVNRFVAEHPRASFDEVESSCFSGLDGKHRMSALSPRLFEAAATRTCQILLKDRYFGLEPWRHYIPLEPDLSNLDQVLDAMGDLPSAQNMVDACYQELIASGRYSYGQFAQRVATAVTGPVPDSGDPALRCFDGAEEEALLEAPRRLGSDLFEVFRIWLLRAQRRHELDVVLEALAATEHPGWFPGIACEDARHAMTGPEGRALETSLSLAAVAEIQHQGGIKACRKWIDALRTGKIDTEQLRPWLDPEVVRSDPGARESRSEDQSPPSSGWQV